MSLFQAREWWGTRAGEQEEFDKGCLCLGNVDNDASGDDKVVVGSFQGMLRVYYPKQPDFSVQDLILEEDLSSHGPILQLLVGRFVP
jgi:Bardet-Biedl syndrome 9 protein